MQADSRPGRERLIIFTRYPEPGKVKTRLVPVLGAEGAADLQRRMTQHALAQVTEFARGRGVTIEVRYEGGDETLVRECFGAAFRYRPQGDGDLGDRMHVAFMDAFESGAERVVIEGADCPGITADILRRAFDAVGKCDLVLGPANDGGYYLIGLRRAIPELFAAIPWGTDEVFSRTMAAANGRGLSVSLLEPLDDVDRPEDLRAWRHSGVRHTGISVVVPTLNEAHVIADALRSIGEPADTEVIVVDGGSSDGTVRVAERHGARTLTSRPCRAAQMNAGAAVATGDILLFLHADTRLPDGFAAHVRQAVSLPGVVGGAFEFSVAARTFGLRAIERLANWRSRWLQMPYGDQGVFLTADLFREMGGFREIEIMEDFEFVRRLRRRGRVVTLPVPAVTSARRWETLGTLRATVMNQAAILGFLLGIPPARVARWYCRPEPEHAGASGMGQ